MPLPLVIVTIFLLGFAVACAGPSKKVLSVDKPSDELPPEEIAVPGPLTVRLAVSNDTLEAEKATIAAALTTWEEATNGQVIFDIRFEETVCDQHYAIHFETRPDCGLTCIDSEKCHRGRAAPPFIVVIARGQDLDQLYFAIVHELGHCFGLEHGDGFMSTGEADLPYVQNTFITSAQLDFIATRFNLEREKMPQEQVDFEYLTHLQRAAPFIVYAD